MAFSLICLEFIYLDFLESFRIYAQALELDFLKKILCEMNNVPRVSL